MDPAVSTWDYNGYTDSDDVQFKAPGHRPARSFRELQDKFGYEKHRVEVGFDDLVNVPPPQGEAVVRSPQNFGDYRRKLARDRWMPEWSCPTSTTGSLVGLPTWGD